MKHAILVWSLLPLTTLAQAPTLTATTPARNAVAAPRLSPVTLTFSGPVTGAADLRVHGSQWRGQRSGTASGDGTSTLRFQPRQAFAPGEQVNVTVPATVRGSGSSGLPLASGQVLAFQAASGPATGTFQPRPIIGDIYGSSTGYYDPQLVDVNNDGKLDFLQTDAVSSQNRVLIYLGDGQGGFASPLSTYVGSEPFSLAAADFNNDGNLDLMTSGWNGAVGRYVTAIALGNGQGQFTPRTTLPTSQGLSTSNGLAQSPRAADLNGDGYLDVAFLEHAPGASGPGTTAHTSLLVGMGDGQGNFTRLPDRPLPWAGTGGARFRLADLNNDGRLDLLYHDPNNQFGAYLGNGQGGFAATPVVTPGIIPQLLVDFTGDGVLDALSISNLDARIHAGNGQGGFATTGTLAFTLPRAVHSLTTGDVDGDGDLDVLTSAQVPNPGGGFTREARVWMNGGSATFTAGVVTTAAYGPITTGDVNNDGTLDMVILDTYSGYISVQLNAPLATAPTMSSFSPTAGGASSLVTVTGTNFTGATAVLVGGVPITTFTVVNATTITFLMPAPTPAGLITVMTPTGQASSNRPFLLATATRASANALPVQLFPNPASSEVRVLLPASGSLQAAFYNALGQCVRTTTQPAPVAEARLDLHGLAPGLYTLRLQQGGRTATQQLVVE
ncbi:hypothetical protein GCM10023185_24530 [Hymenobacter saemangeumensis]|uniref:T9SS type A sorting domain-containing protein n=1 Tax=Hymenobacter saemangeumensis TaxID=1084522 RepID=A0ABP8IH81_9BACT